MGFTIWDKDVGKEDDFLGEAILPGEEIFPAGFAGELLLDKAGKGVTAYLDVRITTGIALRAAFAGPSSPGNAANALGRSTRLSQSPSGVAANSLGSSLGRSGRMGLQSSPAGNNQLALLQ